jgi:O-glycosyl hydrolase
MRLPWRLSGLLLAIASAATARAQTVTIDTTTRFQVIDGFGTCLGETEPANAWWQQL